MNNQAVTPFHRQQDKNPFKSDDAERLIRARVLDSKNVVITEHAEERLEERGMTTLDLFLILKTGYVIKQPVTNTRGDWEVIVEKRLRGLRDAGVVTIILTHGAKLIVKTVQWMDYP